MAKRNKGVTGLLIGEHLLDHSHHETKILKALSAPPPPPALTVLTPPVLPNVLEMMECRQG